MAFFFAFLFARVVEESAVKTILRSLVLVIFFSIYSLMGKAISQMTLLHCELALCKFVALIPSLYGEEYLSFNVHLLTHLTASVDRWGPLWATSAFFFEDANDKLLTFFNGTRGVCNQVFKSFIGANHLLSLADRYAKDVHLSLLDKIAGICRSQKAQKLAKDCLALGSSANTL